MPSAPTLPWLATTPPARTGSRTFRRRRPSIAQLRRGGAAIVLGLAVWFAIQALSPAPPPDQALTVVRDLPAGHTVADADLRPTRVPADLLPSDAMADTSEVVGRRLARAITVNEMVTARSLTTVRELSETQRAVHIPIADPGVLAFVREGDHVDLVEAGGGRTVASDVRVLAVDAPGEETAGHGLVAVVADAHLGALVPAMGASGAGVTAVLRTP